MDSGQGSPLWHRWPVTIDDIARHIDKGLQFVDGILELSKAFNTVPHDKLLHKLESYGIRGQLHTWIMDCIIPNRQTHEGDHGRRGIHWNNRWLQCATCHRPRAPPTPHANKWPPRQSNLKRTTIRRQLSVIQTCDLPERSPSPPRRLQTDMGKKPASLSLNFSTNSLASSYFFSVASALTSASSYFKRGASGSYGFVLGFPKMTRLRPASWDFSSQFLEEFLYLFLYFNGF